MLNNLKRASLISLGQVSNNKCTIILTQDNLIAAKDKDIQVNMHPNKVLFKGYRNPHDSLYDILLRQTTVTNENFLYPTTHAAMYSSKNHHDKKISALRPRTLPRIFLRDTNKFAVNNIKNNDLDAILAPYIKENKCHKIAYNDKKIVFTTDSTKSCFPSLVLKPLLNITIRCNKQKNNLASFLHSACFATTLPTWCIAVANDQFIT